MLNVIVDYCYQNNYELEIIDTLESGLDKRYPSIKYNIFSMKSLTTYNKIKKIISLSRNTINIWGGGTIFTDCDGDGNYRYFSMIKKLGGKIGYLGIGIGNISIQDRIDKTKYLLNKCNFAIFRDKTSLDRARNLSKNKNFYLAEDLSYLFFSSFKPEQKVKDEHLLITWRNLVGYLSKEEEHKYMLELAENSVKLCKEFNISKIKLLALDTNYDIESCNYMEKLFENMGINVVYDTDSSIENITNSIVNSRFHFSARLHGSIASEFLGVPTYSLAYSPKIKYFYESINANNYIDIYKDRLEYKKIKEVFLSYRKSDFSQKIKDANNNFNFLKKLI